MENNSNVAEATTYDQPFTMKEGQLMIFKNTKKDADAQPDYWGKALIDGVEKRVGLWVNESSTGTKYFNGNIRDYVPNNTEAKSENDDLPF